MARPQNRKRQRADELSQDDPPPKKIKSTGEHHDSWQYPPEFWDRLSKIPLTQNALEELDRRTSNSRPSFPPPGPTGLVSHSVRTTATRELAGFARHGGPDLCDLRRYPEPTKDHQPTGAMSSDQSSRSRATKSTDPTTVSTTSRTTKSKKSRTPCDRGFEQHMTDHSVHPTYKSRKADLEEIRAVMAVPRPSLSPSKFSEGAFEGFQESDAQAKDEDDVRVYVVPTITGARRTDHPSAMNTLFGNLESLTDGTIAPAKPDIYFGAYPETLERPIRDELDRHVIPSTLEDKPMAPNFFVEVKGPYGAPAVATLQARYDGAIGARAMHSLQNYGEDKPVYDGKAYTFSSTYHAGTGTLQLYAHHPNAPTTPGGRPEYHMTQVDTWGMTGNMDSFRRGATAARNARDLAKQHRDSFIQAANVRVPQPDTQSSSGLDGTDATDVQREEESGSLEDGVDYVDYSASQDVSGEEPPTQHPEDATEWCDDARVDNIGYSFSQDNGEPPTPQHPDAANWYEDDEFAISQHVPYQNDVLQSPGLEAPRQKPHLSTDEGEDVGLSRRVMEVRVTKFSHMLHADEFVFYNGKTKVVTRKQDGKEVEYNGKTAWACDGKKTTYISRKRIGWPCVKWRIGWIWCRLCWLSTACTNSDLPILRDILVPRVHTAVRANCRQLVPGATAAPWELVPERTSWAWRCPEPDGPAGRVTLGRRLRLSRECERVAAGAEGGRCQQASKPGILSTGESTMNDTGVTECVAIDSRADRALIAA
ncbi:hypothetical protein B0T16DRAFT_8588 [Cercophora newfieldiana]|uniref:DUF7924 domain-containing protein n=1 Tax=Cercophora newfieldiana TaxID=92897 RepID=A0AA40CXR4_9PEZI|nr:hypothetical protein B0T16DRAFT_8588 [Cercophora newfieldiana]